MNREQRKYFFNRLESTYMKAVNEINKKANEAIEKLEGPNIRIARLMLDPDIQRRMIQCMAEFFSNKDHQQDPIRMGVNLDRYYRGLDFMLYIPEIREAFEDHQKEMDSINARRNSMSEQLHREQQRIKDNVMFGEDAKELLNAIQSFSKLATELVGRFE
jgi:hypothetical protein